MTALRKILIISLLPVLLLLPVSLRADVFLVSVGVADYPGTSMDLRNPANDAKAIKWVYSQNAKNKHRLHYRMLLDAQATASNVVVAMNSLFAAAGEDDIVVFFFSGHGYQGGFCAYDGALCYDKIRRAMVKSRCKNKMIFADACYAGDMRKGGNVHENDNSALRKSNIMLFLASRSNEVAYDGTGTNGFFTYYLQNGLRGRADSNKDRVITARELFRYVHANLARLQLQHPVMWGNFSDNMPVMIWR